MSFTAQVASTISLGSLNLQSSNSYSADGLIQQTAALPAGNAGTLSTRTDDDTGIVTLAADHGLTTDDTVDLYWTGGVAYGFAVTLVDGTDVTIDTGSGDALPDQDTAIVCSKRVAIDCDFDGDLAALVVAHATTRAHVEFVTAAAANLHAVELAANAAWQWADDSGVTNPLTGDPVGAIHVSAGTAAAATISIGVLYDSTS